MFQLFFSLYIYFYSANINLQMIVVGEETSARLITQLGGNFDYFALVDEQTGATEEVVNLATDASIELTCDTVRSFHSLHSFLQPSNF